jgi:hypothetical protein
MTMHIFTTPMEEVYRRPYGLRFCFVCRRYRDFDVIVSAPLGLTYYGPTTSVECLHCRTVDGDCFPGTERCWEDE